MKIGLEQGKCKNRYIYSYMPESDTLTLDEELDASLVRLSITSDNVLELHRILPDLLSEISQNRNCGWQLLTGWNELTPQLTPARARLKEKKLLEIGFRFASRDGIRIGVSRQVMKMNEAVCKQLLARSCYAACVDYDLFANESIDACIALLRSSTRMFPAPNASSLSFLKHTRGVLVFGVIGSNICSGVVLVSGDDIEIKDMVNGGKLPCSLVGNDLADSVWAR